MINKSVIYINPLKLFLNKLRWKNSMLVQIDWMLKEFIIRVTKKEHGRVFYTSADPQDV